MVHMDKGINPGFFVVKGLVADAVNYTAGTGGCRYFTRGKTLREKALFGWSPAR